MDEAVIGAGKYEVTERSTKEGVQEKLCNASGRKDNPLIAPCIQGYGPCYAPPAC